ncbi:MAG: tail fiber domain-containing protein [Myxococcaceae bacterium]|nr:tail fiber domain-containing protein [Myxococcaceae bacterium]
MPPNFNNLVRTYYYQGELLQLADFVRDQRYVRDLVRAQNVSVFSPGVACGLTLSAQGTVVTADAGFAFDGNGVPLVVAQPTPLDISGLQLAAGDYYVSLAYADDSAGNVSNLRTTHTITEQPVLQKPSTDVPPAPAIVLGKITVGPDGNISGVDQSPASKRQLATVLLPPASATAPKSLEATAPGDGLRGPLSVGPLPGDGSTMLQVAQELSPGAKEVSVARFDRLEHGASAAQVRIHARRPEGSAALLSAEVNGREVWSLDEDGTARTLSDGALKVDVQPVEDALGRLEALRPVSFAWADRRGPRRMGLIAQEVEQVLPELVGRTKDGHATVAYGDLVPLLVQAVRELSEEVRRLKAERER